MVTDEVADATDTPDEQAEVREVPPEPGPDAVVVPEPETAEEATPGEAAADDAAPEEVAPEEIAAAPSNKHWYVVKVQSGREDTIKEAVERKVRIEGLEEFYGQIFIPTEKVTEMRNGKRYTRTRKTLPGYIMTEVEFNDRILYLFRETSGVGDFVGGTNNKPPPPMTQREIDKWMKKAGPKEEDDPKKPLKHNFEKGERVRVKDGVFKEMEGEIKDILEAKNQIKVDVTIFGRPVAVELEYWQVEKL